MSSTPSVVGRLAPSPTGLLHIGNARSLLLAWLSVRSRGGILSLRVEDIDAERLRAGAVEALLEDLAWLGLDYDGEVEFQSERLAAYDAVVDDLVRRGLAYPCVCSRKEALEAASAPHEPWNDGPVYAGTCRGMYRDQADAERRTGRQAAIRFAVDVEAVPFTDRFLGPCPGRIAGDFVIRRKGGGAAYQTAVVVDDAAAGVREVLRGDDLLASTPRQLLLYRALGLPPPEFVHVPLVFDAEGQRLAKRRDSRSLRSLREAGADPHALIGWIAGRSGLVADTMARTPESLLAGFDLRALDPRPLCIGDQEFGETAAQAPDS